MTRNIMVKKVNDSQFTTTVESSGEYLIIIHPCKAPASKSALVYFDAETSEVNKTNAFLYDSKLLGARFCYLRSEGSTLLPITLSAGDVQIRFNGWNGQDAPLIRRITLLPRRQERSSEHSVFIHGSCVTRDAFSRVENSIEIDGYYARSSIRSHLYSPLQLTDSEVNLSSKFKRRMVVNDWTKKLWRDLSNSKAQVFVLDFIDERFDLAKFQRSAATLSVEAIRGEVFKSVPYKRELQTFDLFRRDFPLFIKSCLQLLDMNEENIVINKVFYATKIDNKGTVLEITDEKYETKRISKQNTFLTQIYQFIETYYPNIKFIEHDELIADGSHQWGFAPFHYTNEANVKIIHYLENL